MDHVRIDMLNVITPIYTRGQPNASDEISQLTICNYLQFTEWVSGFYPAYERGLSLEVKFCRFSGFK